MTPEQWAKATPWLQEALDSAGATHTVEDVQGLFAQGTCHIWMGERCIVVTEPSITRKPSIHIWLVGGEKNNGALEEARAIEVGIAAFARAAGMCRLTGSGREGWGVAMRDAGWTKAFAIFKKDL